MATETYELAIEGTVVASYRQTLLHFTGVGVASVDTVAAGESLIAGFIANCEVSFLLTLPQAYSINAYRARRATPKPSFVSHQEFGVGVKQGTRGSDAVGQQTCPSIFLVPTMGTKSGGRIFWPSIPAGDVQQSSYVAAWQTAVNTALTAMTTGFTNAGITWTLAIFSRKLLTASTVAGHNFSPLIGFQAKRRSPIGAVA